MCRVPLYSLHVIWLLLLAGRILAQDITANGVTEQLVPPGAQWRYFRGTAEPSGNTLAWTQPGFVDGAWLTGAAGIGYADGDDATVLSDMRNGYTTVYLRRAFSIAEPGAFASLELEIDYDDGFVAYLNGQEIARANAGAAGIRPAFDDVASDSHEAGTPEVTRIEDAGSLLRAGVNVLAVVGLNSTIDSGDFSLHPSLRSADVLGEGCPGDVYVAGSRVTLAGIAPVPGTASVRVNGEAATFDAGTGDWFRVEPVPVAGAIFTAEALSAAGQVLSTATVRVIRARVLSGDLADGTTLTPASAPYVVVGAAAVRAGSRLVVEAGCEVFFLAGAGLRLEGQVEAIGTSAAPIRFTRLPCGPNWGHFELLASRGGNRFAFCEWSFATGDPGCLTVEDSDLELESCVVRDIDGEGVHATDSTTRIRRCLTERTREALSLDRGDTVVEHCEVRDVIEKSDLIDCNGSSDPPPRLAYNLLHGTTDDGVDADRSSIVAEWNVIHDCGDQAFSLVGEGTSRISHNICYRNGNGLSVKDGQVCIAEFNTFALNTVTGVRSIEKTVGGGAGIITLRSSIVWGNAVQLLIEADGSIDVAYCDVEGGAPAGPGNLSLDPRFADLAAGDFRLLEGSPCIGAAADGSDVGALPYELVPLAPEELRALAQGSDAIWLSWRDTSAVEDGFELERAPGDGAFALVATLPPGTTELTDRELDPATLYRYRVRTRNGLGASPWSEVASALTAPLSAPEVSAVEPASGPSGGGTAITIRGRNLLDITAARLGGIALLDLEILGAEELRARTPPGGRGLADLRVSSAAGEAVLPGAFAYYEPHARGDANGDAARDLADVLTTLRYLFQDGTPPACPDVADTNADGTVDIADPVSLLLHLFAGGAAPAPDEARCIG